MKVAVQASVKQTTGMSRQSYCGQPLEGTRVFILAGEFQGREGVCLGQQDGNRWAISPDESGDVLSLVFEKDFGLLVDLSANPERN